MGQPALPHLPLHEMRSPHTREAHLHQVEKTNGVDVQAPIQPIDGVVPQPRAPEFNACEPIPREAMSQGGVHALQWIGPSARVAVARVEHLRVNVKGTMENSYKGKT